LIRQALFASLLWVGIAPLAFPQSIAERFAAGRLDELRTEMAAHPQGLATFNAFVGRADLNEGLEGVPPGAETCPSEGLRAVDAAAWLLAQSRHARVLMFNENHHVPAARVFVRALLPRLRAAGFTHVGFETLSPPGPEPRVYSAADGYYSVEPTYAALIREARAQGMELFAYESLKDAGEGASMHDRIAAREEGQAENLARAVGAGPPNSRFIVFAGWSHIAEAELPAGGGIFHRWMAARFRQSTGIDPFTVDLTSCAHSSSKRGGQVLLDAARRSVVHGRYAGAVDAQVSLPAPPAAGMPGFYRSSLGVAVPVPENLRVDGPVLVEARDSRSGAADVAFDRLLLQKGEKFPLYLPTGTYDLVAHRGDGSLIGRERVQVGRKGSKHLTAPP
jgi:hypothetical protein